MTDDERRELERLVERGPRSRLGYWPFAVPFLFLIGAALLQATLLVRLQVVEGAFEILLRQGTQVEPLFEHEQVVRLVLTWNFVLVLGLASVCFLANQTFRCRVLLRKAAQGLDLDPTDALDSR